MVRIFFIRPSIGVSFLQNRRKAVSWKFVYNLEDKNSYSLIFKFSRSCQLPSAREPFVDDSSSNILTFHAPSTAHDKLIPRCWGSFLNLLGGCQNCLELLLDGELSIEEETKAHQTVKWSETPNLVVRALSSVPLHGLVLPVPSSFGTRLHF